MGFGSFCDTMVGRVIGDIKIEILKTSLVGKEKKKKEKKKKKEIKRRERTLQINLRTAGTRSARGLCPRVPPNTVPQNNN